MLASKRPYSESSRTRKWLLASGIVLAAICLARFSADIALKEVAENLFSETLQTEVKVGSVAIDSWEGHISFYNTRIRNLEGFSKPYIFKAKVIQVEGSLWDFLRHSQVNIRMIEIDHVETWIQKNKDGYNYEELLRNLEPPSSDEPEDTNPPHNANNSDSPSETSDSDDNDISIAEIRIQDVKTAVYDFIPSAHISSQSEENARLDLTWKTIVLRHINLGTGGRAAARHLSTIITKALLTASARKVGSLPLDLVKKGLSLGGATLDIMSEETHSEDLKDSIQSVGRGASEWLRRLLPSHDREAQPPSPGENQNRR